MVEFDSTNIRRHMCNALFHSPARATDPQWSTTRPQASLTTYQREVRNYVFLSFAEDPHTPAKGVADGKGNIPWPPSGPQWHPGRKVVLYGDQACVKTEGCTSVSIPLSSPQSTVVELVRTAQSLQPVGGVA